MQSWYPPPRVVSLRDDWLDHLATNKTNAAAIARWKKAAQRGEITPLADLRRDEVECDD